MGEPQQASVLIDMAQLLWCIHLCWAVCGVGQTTAGPARLFNEGDCKSKFLTTQGVHCLTCADHNAGIMQSRMSLREPLICHASWQPFCRRQHKPEKVAGTESTRFQRDQAFDAQQTLEDAGYRSRQAQGLLRVMGGVLKPVALQSSVLKLEQDLRAVKQDVKAVDYKTTILIVIVVAEIAADPNHFLRDIMARLLDLLKPVAGA